MRARLRGPLHPRPVECKCSSTPPQPQQSSVSLHCPWFRMDRHHRPCPLPDSLSSSSFIMILALCCVLTILDCCYHCLSRHWLQPLHGAGHAMKPRQGRDHLRGSQLAMGWPPLHPAFDHLPARLAFLRSRDLGADNLTCRVACMICSPTCTSGTESACPCPPHDLWCMTRPLVDPVLSRDATRHVPMHVCLHAWLRALRGSLGRGSGWGGLLLRLADAVSGMMRFGSLRID
mmetsp:Transcript_39083/g.88751  ORF Transcript_39083/g.88751 Transcript_39083/m.88751 type:complete len:232 (+) Transcript_39083:493-1188(+)